MKRLILISLLFFSVGLPIGCNQQPAEKTPTVIDINPAKLPTLRTGEAVATVAGGCFWAVQEEMKSLKGVRVAISGYAGGDLDYPTYEQVGTDQTGHAETVQIYYDPKVISYDVLLDAFFAGHDATQLNRQGPDIGKHYRSAIFYRTPGEKARIDAAIRRENASGHHKVPVVTQVAPFKAFYPAEVYHQDYYQHNFYNNLYIQLVSKAKVEKFREQMEGRLKD
ncbi:peptide-methionine (S)-S-oxide reductase MsrA [Spirosoma sp. KCTC 42546]|uniref:peptide-methionine (S)-S-oxide reductase MsrA n=1 Tax=Spirosoma sp. KCTC 42546 TaxID=2520506 RepID=UPI0011571296|nr:peptide-methionine (S)-S-oxide reductase MsrA [Spirosoma sp. KCTC 42546]QDK79471.1 peptide-methionine (S)-S-oxide reductase MsrA [Spirosoma sp. KCTC 42546]